MTNDAPAPIGWLIWYSIGSSDEPLAMTRDELKGWLTEVGIDHGFLPAADRAVNAFRSATSNLKMTYQFEGITYRFSIEEVEATSESVTRNVYAVWQNPDGAGELRKRMAYMQFFRPVRNSSGRIRGTERLKVLVDRRLTGVHKAKATEFATLAHTMVAAAQQRLNAHAVRATVRNYLLSIGAVPVNGSTGGWYLVTPEQQANVEAMRTVVRRCGDKCGMRMIPLLPGPDMKDMLVESVDIDIYNRAQLLIKACADWIESNPLGGAPTTARWSSWMADTAVLQDLLVTYMERYDATFPAAANALEQLVDVVDQIGRRVATATARRA